MKKTDLIIREYVSKLPFDTLKFLTERFRDRVGSDLADAIEIISKSSDMDKILATAKNADEFFNSLDFIASFVEKEFTRRVPDLSD